MMMRTITHSVPFVCKAWLTRCAAMLVRFNLAKQVQE
jgi:hypothetical protein